MKKSFVLRMCLACGVLASSVTQGSGSPRLRDNFLDKGEGAPSALRVVPVTNLDGLCADQDMLADVGPTALGISSSDAAKVEAGTHQIDWSSDAAARGSDSDSEFEVSELEDKLSKFRDLGKSMDRRGSAPIAASGFLSIKSDSKRLSLPGLDEKPPISQLYDGLKLQIKHAPLQELYNPYDYHLTLTSYDIKKNDRNTAKFSLTFFAHNGSVKHFFEPKVFVFGSNGRVGTIHGGTLFPTKGADPKYKEFLEWLLKLYPTSKTINAALKNSEKAFTNQGFNRDFHHTEQWILLYIHNNLQQWVTDLDADFLLKGLKINIYTHNNPCKDCGLSIEKALPLFQDQIKKIGELIGRDLSSVYITSSISSTLSYEEKSYLSMPELTDAVSDIVPSYQEAYAKSVVVVNPIVQLNHAHGNCYHFWIPKLEGVTFTLEPQGLMVTINKPDKALEFKRGFSTHKHVAERVKILNLEAPVIFTTNGSVGEPSVFNPYDFYDETRLSYMPFKNSIISLRLGGANARSNYMVDMLKTFTNLLSLDLRGSVRNYEDGGEAEEGSRNSLWSALRMLPRLSFLDLGAYQKSDAVAVSNNIKFNEFAFLLSISAGDMIPFPCIEILKLNGNQIFEKTEDAVADSAGEILSQFINAAERTAAPKEINLSDNGKYLHVSAAQAGRSLSKVAIATDIIF